MFKLITSKSENLGMGSGPFYIPFVIENIQREGFDSLKYLVEIAFDIVHVLVGKLLILHL